MDHFFLFKNLWKYYQRKSWTCKQISTSEALTETGITPYYKTGRKQDEKFRKVSEQAFI